MLTSALGTLVAVIFLLLVVLLAKVLLPTGLLRLAATGQFGSAFRFGENLALVGANLRTYIYLLLTLILFAIPRGRQACCSASSGPFRARSGGSPPPAPPSATPVG